jgi:chemotaxis signal transduction protein
VSENMEIDYYLLVKTREKSYAIKASIVIEVLLVEGVQKIPGSKEYVAGVLVRNGVLIPLIDIESEKCSGNYYNYYAIIVSNNDRYIGFLCERIDMVKGEKVNIISDNSLLRRYNYNEAFVELLIEIDDKIYGLIEKEKLYRIIEENKIRRN